MSPRALAVLALALCTSGMAQEALPVDPRNGLVIDDNWELVQANCAACHSLGLVTQNRMSAENWIRTIRWMQEKHNLWDLGDSETGLVAYLAEHYGVPDLAPRRRPLNQQPLEQERSP